MVINDKQLAVLEPANTGDAVEIPSLFTFNQGLERIIAIAFGPDRTCTIHDGDAEADDHDNPQVLSHSQILTRSIRL